MNKIVRFGILFLALALIAAAVISCGKPKETDDDEWTPPAKDSETEAVIDTPETEEILGEESEVTLPKDEF